MSYHIGVIQFPGSNCERETKCALLRAGLNPIDIFWFDDAEKLKGCDGYVIVGGFSFEDRGRSGVIAAHDPLIKKLVIEAQTGKPILGICNGAQILVESGLVPGCVDENNQLETVVALAHNRRIVDGKVIGTGFYNAWVWVQFEKNKPVNIPVAHAEGRFLMSDALYDDMQKFNVACWYYVDENGNQHSHFPTNPNGSYQNLAAIGNFSGNIIAMMPHPERSIAGNIVFDQMKNHLTHQKPFHWITKSAQKYRQPLAQTQLEKFSKMYFVTLLITDNEAASVQMALQQMNIPIQIQRYRFWGCIAEKSDLEKIECSFELWNPQKEIVRTVLPTMHNTQFLWVMDPDDVIAEQKRIRLREKSGAHSLTNLKTGVIWQLSGSERAIEKAIASHLFFNPISQHAFILKEKTTCPV